MAATTVEERAVELARRAPLSDGAVSELVELAGGRRDPLESAARTFVARLHRRSDDYEATNALRLVNRALVRIGWDDSGCPRLASAVTLGHEQAEALGPSHRRRIRSRLRWPRRRRQVAWT